MNKILLAGKLDKAIEELYNGLLGKFDVQLSTVSWEIIEPMIQITKSEVLVLQIADIDDVDEEMFSALENDYPKLPVVVLGLEAGCTKYEQFKGRTLLSILDHSVDMVELSQICFQKIEDAAMLKSIEMEEAVKSGHILVVDDSPVILRGIKAMLDKDYAVSVVTSGEQALKFIKKKRPDLILLDYEMPGWDGKETLEKIREDEETRDIPVMFLTGVADMEHISAVLKLEPAGYFLKPADKEKLMAAIQGVLKTNT